MTDSTVAEEFTTDGGFTAEDDGLHPVSDNFYETETFWFSFFVPERNIGAWVYVSVRANAGTTGGGLWLWDHTGSEPWNVPFFEGFSHLKPPKFEDGVLTSPTGATITVVQPGMEYAVRYDDRERITADLHFVGLERPVPLRSGSPPYPSASHYDQTGRVTGTVVLDGERIDVDCYAMRDRSWGPRTERGYRRVGYTWLVDPQLSLLTYSAPTDVSDDIHSGYVRRGEDIVAVRGGHRKAGRDPERGWIESLDLTAVDENGAEITVSGRARSRLILPGSTNICINTLLEFDVDGRIVYGEDQDVWPIKEFRKAVRPD